jgi:AAA domain
MSCNGSVTGHGPSVMQPPTLPEGRPVNRAVRLVSLPEMAALPLPQWRIYHLLYGITLLWAGPGSFKTFLAISWAVAVASGQRWCGRRVRQGTVVFIVGEGGLRAFHSRVTAAAAVFGFSPREALALPIFGTDGAVNLATWNGTQAQQLRDAALRVAEDVGPVGLLVVDTVSRCVPGKENDQEVMQAFVQTLDELHAELGCDVVAIHHSNAEGERSRGSSVLPGAVDGNLHVVPGAPDAEGSVPLSLYAHKLKEAESGEGRPAVARLLAIQTPVFGLNGSAVRDEEGNPLMTCQLIEDDNSALAADREDERLLSAIPDSDGISASKLTTVLRRNKRLVLADLGRLARSGKVEQRGRGKSSRWHRRSGSSGAEPVSHRSEPQASIGSSGSGSQDPDRKPIAQTDAGTNRANDSGLR